jgi:hypothetical protein
MTLRDLPADYADADTTDDTRGKYRTPSKGRERSEEL